MKTKIHTPELGQLIFGQPSKKYECSNLMEAAFLLIEKELKIVLWNIHQKQLPSPFGNNGTNFKYKDLEIESYIWNDDIEQHYNFKYKDIEVSWYKSMGRSMSQNRKITNNEISKMLDACLLLLTEYQNESVVSRLNGLKT